MRLSSSLSRARPFHSSSSQRIRHFSARSFESLEIIGEAVKKLPGDFTTQHPQVEWRLIAGMRDRLIHGYFAVDYALVWDVVQNKVPGVATEIRAILRQA